MSVQSIHAFAEKVALVTDGSTPIGRAIALQLALQGSYVIVGYPKSADEVKSTIDELISLGTLALAFEADLSRVNGVEKLINEVDNAFGRLDLLVNCLKFSADSSFEETTEEIFDNAFRQNAASAFFAIQYGLRLMSPRPKARIVNVCFACDSDDISFAMSQSAVGELTRRLADKLPRNVLINAVEVHKGTEAEKPEFDSELIRPRKGVLPDDIARIVLFLLSSEAASVNGEIIAVR